MALDLLGKFPLLLDSLLTDKEKLYRLLPLWWQSIYVRRIKYLKMNKEQKEIERKEYKEYLTVADKRVLDTNKSGIELIADDEVFVLVNNAHNYWISNHGRMTNNNLRKNFYMHKMGNAHYTITVYSPENVCFSIETYCDKLVAEHFLEKPKGCDRVWHIDRNKNNCHYKNLMWVSYEEYLDLSRQVVFAHELGRRQEYIPYITLKGNVAYSIWNGIYIRCYRKDISSSGKCYEKATMCEQWLKDKDLFVEWYNANYYECEGESMAVDKDLLYPGNSEYSPDKCCILPQTLNTMLSNCKKHKLPKWKSSSMNLPLGVRYSSSMKMYYAEIKPFGHDEIIQLSHWDSPEEAFAEYKKYKQADILIMAAKYKNKIPKYIYEALLKVDVEPY